MRASPVALCLVLLSCAESRPDHADSGTGIDATVRVQDNANQGSSDAFPNADAEPSEDDSADAADDPGLETADASPGSGGDDDDGATEQDAQASSATDAGLDASAQDAAEPSEAGAAAADAGETVDADSDGGDARSEDASADAAPDASDRVCTQCGACEETIAVTGAEHQPEPITYTDLPPAGGPHANCWTAFGVHDQQVPAARWVHNQEHGGVVFLYNCPDGCADEVSELAALASSRPFAVVVPYPEMATRFGVVAWGQRLVSDCFDRAAFADFYARHANHGTESNLQPPPDGC